jgi:ectoine hydroxylase-related dioxygenase (phytanoyl-CoA dioxygenase family)
MTEPRDRARRSSRVIEGDCMTASGTTSRDDFPGLTADLADLHAQRVAEHGWTVVENAIEHDLIDEIAETLDRLEHDLGIVPGTNSFEGHATVRIYNLLAHDELFWRVPVHPMVLPVVERVLDTGCLVSSLSSIAIGPGERAQPIHADDQLIPLDKPHRPIVCNSMWAITDFTDDNGATRLVPRTHLADGNPNPFEHHDTIAAEMTRGSVLVWNGSLWHGGGANSTDERRVGIAMNYCAGYIRQQENQQLGIPHHMVTRMPARLQELIGFGVYNGLIGHIDKQKPTVVLGHEGAQRMIWDT